MKKVLLIALAALMSLAMVSCTADSEPSSQEQSSEVEASSSEPSEAESSSSEVSEPELTQNTAILYADKSSGNVEELPEDVEQYNFHYEGELTVGLLADGLTILTGLEFALNDVTIEGTVARVDWAESSTLLSGLGDTVQNDEFFFYDAEGLNWFMLESLYQTIIHNFDVSEVYYTMEGGEALTVNELYPISTFTTDLPYMGSSFYFNHSDNTGDIDAPDERFSITTGTWRFDGAMDTAYFVMDGMGNFTAYYASGSMENAGYLEFVDEFGDGNVRFDMYTYEGTYLNSFMYETNEQFYMTSNEALIYIKSN